jgi:hypothetical protein
MPHFDETSPEDSEHSEDLSLSMNHPPAATSDYGIAVNRTSTTRDGSKFEPRYDTPSLYGPMVPFPLQPSVFLVRCRNAGSLAVPDITYKFRPSCIGDTAPPSHEEKANEFLKGLVLLSRNGTPHVGSEHKPNVASYIADKDGEWHPWVKVSRGDEVDEDDEPETVQMCLTVNEPSNMETGVVDADPPLSAQDGEVYGQRV